LTRFVRRAYQGAFSRGPGYEPHPRGGLVDESGTGGYYVDYRAKIQTRECHPDAPLLPAETAQLGLGWHERYLLGDPTATEPFLSVCEELRSAAVRVTGGIAWPYTVRVPKYPLPRPWFSGMAQGQIASLFVRAWKMTGEESFAHLALQAVGPLLDQPAFAGLVTRTYDGPAIEECGPMKPASHVLNGWIFGLWGLRDVSLALDDPRCRRLAAETTECLAASLSLYDTGWWTRYSLFPHVVTDLAKPFYHRLHVVQIEVMRDLSGEQAFARAATRWRSYDTRRAAAAAVASKVPFAATKRLAVCARPSL
jgi:heparosan-N-sulfate-glucuronate 5-epimerase